MQAPTKALIPVPTHCVAIGPDRDVRADPYMTTSPETDPLGESKEWCAEGDRSATQAWLTAASPLRVHSMGVN